MAAVQEQALRFTHTCFHVAPYESYIGLAERLNALAPTGPENRTMLVMTGAEAVEDRASKRAAPELTSRIVAEAEKHGLILISCGTRFNVIRLLAPLTIADGTLAEGLDFLEESIEAAFSAF